MLAGDEEFRRLTRGAARNIIRGAFARAGSENDGRLGSYTLRKTFARSLYLKKGYNIMGLKAALGHSDISITPKYLEVEKDTVMAAIRKCDFTRKRRAAVRALPAAAAAIAPAA